MGDDKTDCQRSEIIETDAEHDTSTVAEPKDAAEAGDGSPTGDEATDEMAALNAKAKENWDRLLRVTAEFDNFRKRAAREKATSASPPTMSSGPFSCTGFGPILSSSLWPHTSSSRSSLWTSR